MVTFFSIVIPYPKIKLGGVLKQAATGIIIILTAKPSESTTSLHAGDLTRNDLLDIATVLNRAEKLLNSILPNTTTPQKVKI